MPSQNLVIDFEDFSGGDYGRNWPATSGDFRGIVYQSGSVKADPTLNTFKGVNVWKYPKAGAIGPRPPFVLFSPPTPLPSKGVIFAASIIQYAGSIFDTYLFLSDGKIYSTILGSAGGGTALGTPKNYGSLLSDGAILYAPYVPTPAMGFKVQNATITTLVNMPAGDVITRFGPHTVVLKTTSNTFYWSAPNDPATWPVAQFALVPGRALDMTIQKNTLIFVANSINPNLADILTVSGTLSVNAVLRRVDQGLLPSPHVNSPTFANPHGPIQNIAGDTVYWISNHQLVSFNGSEAKTSQAPLPRFLSITTADLGPDFKLGVWSIIPYTDPDSYFVLGSTQQAVSNNNRRGLALFKDTSGAWWPMDPRITYHADLNTDWTQTDVQDQYSSSSAHPQSSLFGVMTYSSGTKQPILQLITAGRAAAAAEAPKIYNMAVNAQSPSTASNDGDSASPVIAEMRTTDWYAPRNQEVSVRAVTVDYVSQNAAAEALTLQVESLSTVDGLTVNASTAQALTKPTLGNVYDGAYYRGRYTFRMQDQGPGQGFRLYFSNWIGLMIERISVTAELTDQRI